jgi:hypothetical protein
MAHAEGEFRLAPSAIVAPSRCTMEASSRPASGPSTPIWRCPAVLVAAIFQPRRAPMPACSSSAWIA